MIDNKAEQKLDDIWKEIVGRPELGKKGRGIISRLDAIESEIETIKKKGVKFRWTLFGASATAGAIAGATGKTIWAKIVSVFSALPK